MAMGIDAIDIRNIAEILRNLFLVYLTGLAILLVYMVALALGVRGLLGLGSPAREILMAIYGLLLTIAWLYGWWRVIRAIRRILIALSGS